MPDIHGHAKGEHKAFTDERPIPLSARMLFLWFYHACRRGWPRFLMVSDHMNYLTFEDPAAINLVRRALKLAQAGDLYGAAETASVEVGHAAVVSEGLRRGMRYSLGAEVDNDPRSRPDAQNIVDAMKPDGMIRSVHFLTVDHPTRGAGWNWPFDNPEFSDVFETVGTQKTWELYMATLLDALERLPGHIVGHFYVPAVFGHWPDDATLDGYENALIDVCEARGLAIEVNTRFLYRDHLPQEKERYLAAHRRLLRKCKARNIGVAIGSDAHSPKDQGRAFGTILALLDECEINEIVFPIAGRLARVALRVERKAEPPVPIPDVPDVVAAADDRKPVRKARTSDVPARSKDSSSKRDDGPSDVAEPTDEPVAKKARPKRNKNRGAARPDDAAEPAADEAPEASGVTQDPTEPFAADSDAFSAGVASADDSSGSAAPEIIADDQTVLVTLTETVETTSAIAAVPEPIDADEAAGDVFAAAAVDDVTYVADDTADDVRRESMPAELASTAKAADADSAALDEDAAAGGEVAGDRAILEQAILDEAAIIAAAVAEAAPDETLIEEAVFVEAAAVAERHSHPLRDESPLESITAVNAQAAVAGQSRSGTRPRRKPASTAKAKSSPAPARAKRKPVTKKSAQPAKPAKKATTATKTPAKKTSAKKTAVKKTVAKKAPAKKAAVRGSVKKASSAKAAPKKPAAKKSPSKRR